MNRREYCIQRALHNIVIAWRNMDIILKRRMPNKCEGPSLNNSRSQTHTKIKIVLSYYNDEFKKNTILPCDIRLLATPGLLASPTH